MMAEALKLLVGVFPSKDEGWIQDALSDATEDFRIDRAMQLDADDQWLKGVKLVPVPHGIYVKDWDDAVGIGIRLYGLQISFSYSDRTVEDEVRAIMQDAPFD